VTRHLRHLALTLSAGILLALIELWPSPARAQKAADKKLIYYGLGIRDTQYVRGHWREIEQMPFDGTGISVAIDRTQPTIGDGVTGNLLGWQVMSPTPFTLNRFQAAINDLKAAKWTAFTDNFIPVALSSGYAKGLNWFDDARWQIVANNFAVLATIAAEGGLKGLILDPEDYNYELFSYRRQQQSINNTFEQYKSMARQRGRQMMTAIAGALPDPVLLSLYGYTMPLGPEQDRVASLQDARAGLLPAFYDGLLEAMPAGGRLIDAYEFSYPFKKRSQFLDGYRRIHKEGLTLSAVPDHYRAKVRAGFGLWLDYYKRPNYFTPEEFQRAVGYALEVSDEYVWIYTHEPKFFPPSGIDPAYIEAIVKARRAIRP
jgi:hypothetical protein